MAHLLTEGGVGAPAAHGEQCAYIDLHAEGAGLGNVGFQSVDELFHRGQIAHRAEDVDLSADRVNDIIDTLLDDDGVGTVGGDLVVEPVTAHKTVGLIGQAGVFPQDPGAGGGPADNGGVAIALPEATQRQVIRPVLGGDGIAVADNGPVLRGGQHGNIAEEVKQVGLAGGLQVDVGILGFVAVGVQALGQGATGIDHAAHQGEVR